MGSEFDLKAQEWDNNPMYWDRSVAVADHIRELIPLRREMTALEFGAGTGITSFLLKDYLKEITMMDSSTEMVRVMNEKIKKTGVQNLKALNFDLEETDYTEANFDFIFTQMALHHVNDIRKILKKFHDLLHPGGYLAIADLYPEDGSFHGDGFTGHKGFDIDILSGQVKDQGFTDISHRKCFVMTRKISDTEIKSFDIFLLIARRGTIK